MSTYTEIFINKARVQSQDWKRFYDEMFHLTKLLHLKDIETVCKYDVEYKQLIDCKELDNYQESNSNAYRILFSQKTNQRMDEFVLYKDLDAYKCDEIRFSLNEDNRVLGKIIEFLRIDFYYATTCLVYEKCENNFKEVIDESKIVKSLKNIQEHFNLEFNDFLNLPTQIKELFFIFKLEGMMVDKKVWEFIFLNIDNERIKMLYSLVKCNQKMQGLCEYMTCDIMHLKSYLKNNQ